MEKKNAIIYARVSSHRQDFERQKTELQQYAWKNGFTIVAIFEEKVSGKAKVRPEFQKMLDFAKVEKIHSVLCWELSRIGRNAGEVINTIQDLNSIGVNAYVHNLQINTLNGSKIDFMAGFMLNILASVSDMESTNIKQRLVSGYANYRNNGGVVGRPLGTEEPVDKFLEKHQDVLKMVKAGKFPVRVIMHVTGKSSGTVQKVKALHKATE